MGDDIVNYKVVYFTRSGSSKRIGEKIANKLSCEVIEITDNMNWKGILGYIKAGYYSSANKSVDIKINGDLSNTDEFIVVTPLWAGGAAPAIRTYFKTTSLDKIHLVVTSMGSIIKDRLGFKSVSDIVRNKKNEDDIIDNLVKSLL